MKFSRVSDCEPGTRIKGIYLCREKEIRLTRSGNRYIQVGLQDSSGYINGNIWAHIEKYEEQFKTGDPVGVTAFVDKYLDESQLRILNIRSLCDTDLSEFRLTFSDLVVSSEKPPSYLYNQALNMARLISSNAIRRLVTNIYVRFKKELTEAPGSSKLHHNYRSGLLEHIVSMVKIARVAALQYKIDEDLLLAGIFLHDLGKLIEISRNYSHDYTNEGYMIGHLVLSRDILLQEAQKIKGLEKKVLLKLEHMILSHHGDYEWQSPRKPCFSEAMLLHLIDRMDAQMNLMIKTIKEDKNAGCWTGRRNYFRMALFKGENEAE